MRSLISSMLVFCFLITTGCGGMGSASSNNGSGIAAEAISKVDVPHIKATVTTAQTSLQNAQAALGTIFNSSGTFNWSIFLGGVDFSTLGANTQTCLANAFPKNNILALVLTAPADIATALKCILDDVVSVASIASTDLTSALITLNAALAQVAPGSADAIAIQAMIDQINPLLTSYNTLMMSLGSQMSIVTSFLSTLPALAAGAIPIPIVGILVGMSVSAFVQPIEVEIMHFQAQIQAL